MRDKDVPSILGIRSDPDKPLHPKRCETCAYFDPPPKGKDEGLCLANFPLVVPMQGQYPGTIGAASLFPPMKPAQRCGKWDENFELTEAAPSQVG